MSQRVFRPLGLTLAIIAAVILFGIWPLVKFYVTWRLNAGQFGGDNLMLAGSTTPFDGFTYLSAILGIVVIVSAGFAWRGRLPWIRFVFQGATLLTVTVLIAEAIARTQTTNADDVLRDVLRCQLPVQAFIALYIVWYNNRAPARAFYRQTPLTQPPPKEEETVS